VPPALSIPPPVPAVIRFAGPIGTVVIVGFLALLRFLPFQDAPNHELVLLIDRALRNGSSEYYVKPDSHAFAYSLYVWMARLFEHVISTGGALRLLFMIAAAALPLSVARLARVINSSHWTAFALSVPLALCWPLRVGLLSYALAIPLAVAMIAAAIELSQATTLARTADLAVWTTLCYLAHPVAFAVGAMVVFVVWASLARRRLHSLLHFSAAALPAAIMLVFDLRHHVFAELEGTVSTWGALPTSFRPQNIAVAQIVTLSFGADNVIALVCVLPLLVLVLRLTWTSQRDTADVGPRRLLLIAALVVMIGSAIAPGNVGVAFKLGERFAIFGVLLLIPVAARWTTDAFRLRYVMIAAVGLATITALVGVTIAERGVQQIVGPAAPHSLSGRYLTARLDDDCALDRASERWALYDPGRHLWAYSLTADGATPYVFAFARYLPVWFRNGGADIVGPPDWHANARIQAPADGDCHKANRRRLGEMLRAARDGAYDGVIITGMPSALHAFGAEVGVPTKAVAPGIVVAVLR
jgi:hypothetical protein